MTSGAAGTPVADPKDRDLRTRQLLAWLGAGLLAGGIPAHEVEEDLRGLATGLGHPQAQIAALPNGLTLCLGPGEPATTERVEGGLRLDQLADVSALVAQLRLAPADQRYAVAQQVLDRLSTLRADPHRYPRFGLIVGGILAGLGIALLLAPAGPSVLFGALLAPVTVTFMALAGRGSTVRVLQPMLAAFVVSLAAFGAAQLGWIEAPLWTLVGPIAVILPGALIVTGLSELAAGALSAGTARLAHGTTQLLLFAVGVLGAIAVLRVPPEMVESTRPAGLGWWAPLLGVFVVTLAISLMESLSLRWLPWLLATVLATFLAQTAGFALVDSRWAGAFLGGVVASLVAALVEYVRPQVPRIIAFLPSFWLLVPGSLGLVTVTTLEYSPQTGLGAVGEVIAVVLAISLGVLVGSSLARPLRGRAQRLGAAIDHETEVGSTETDG